MRSSSAQLKATWHKARSSWQALAARERQALALAAAVLGGALVWLTLIEPPLARISHWQAETPKLRAQAQTLSDLLAQAPKAASGQGEAGLRQSLADAGLGECCQLQAQGEGWQLTWQQAPAEAALGWLLQAPRQQALTVAQAHLQRDPPATPEAAATLSGTLRLDHAPGAKESP